MKKMLFAVFLLGILTACAPAQPTTDVQSTAFAIVQTGIALTQTALPTVTPTATVVYPTPSPLPTQLTLPVTLDPIQAKQQEEVKDVLQAYFDLRYQALSVSPPEDFQLEDIGNLVSHEPEAKAFLDAELDKLALELKYAELNHSKYVDYKYFLTFDSFSMDTVTQLITVSVVEGNEFISENSAKGNPENPHIAHMSGLKHTIVLTKEGDQWRIVSDYYRDFLWRTMKEGESVDKTINMLNTLIAQQNTPTATPIP